MKKTKKPSPTEMQRRSRLVSGVFLILPFVFLLIGIGLLVCVLLEVFPEAPKDYRTLMTFLAAGAVDAAVLLVAVRSMLLVTENEAKTGKKFLAVLLFVLFLLTTALTYLLWYWMTLGKANPLGSINALKLWMPAAQAARFAFLLFGLILCMDKEPAKLSGR